MKRASLILILFLSAMTCRAQTTQKVHVVEITQVTMEKTQQVVTVEVYQSMQAATKVRNRLLPKALDLAEKEWKEKHADDGPLPRHTAAPGQVKSLGQFNDMEKAEQALKDIQAREEQQQKKKKLSGTEKQLEELNKQLKNISGVQNRTAAQQSQVTALETNIKMLNEQIARQQKKEEDKNANLAAAREIFKSKLKQLLVEQEAGKPAETNQPPAAPKR